MKSSIDTKIAESVASCAKQIRSLPLKQQPSISELSEWAKYLSTLNSDEIEEETLKASLCMIAKKRKTVRLWKMKTVLMEECNAKRYS